jgi:hypothetical protein
VCSKPTIQVNRTSKGAEGKNGIKGDMSGKYTNTYRKIASPIADPVTHVWWPARVGRAALLAGESRLRDAEGVADE